MHNQPTSKTPSAFASLKDKKKALQMLLVAFMEDQNWIRLKRSFAIPFFVDAIRSLEHNPAMFGANVLHVALCNKPPIEIVWYILQKFPEAPYLPDIVGRYPQHIANSVGITSKIVGAIAGAFPQACMKQDLDGRTPLHCVCDSSRVMYEEDTTTTNTSFSSQQGHMDFGIVHCLVSIAPSAIIVEDINEMTAIEHTIMSHASRKVVLLLQSLSAVEHYEQQGRLNQGAVTREGIFRMLPCDDLGGEDYTVAQNRSSTSLGIPNWAIVIL